MLTQVSPASKVNEPHEPLVVIVADPTVLPPKVIGIEVAEAAGTIAKAAAITRARIESFKLVFRTTFPLLGYGVFE